MTAVWQGAARCLLPRLPEVPLRFTLIALLAPLSLAACDSTVLDVPSGTFLLEDTQGDVADTGGDGADPNADLLVLDIAGLQFEVQPADGSATTSGSLTLQAEDQWLDDCYTNVSHTTTRSYTMDVGQLVISDYAVASPVISAKCGGRPLVWSAETEGPDSGLVLVFEELPGD